MLSLVGFGAVTVVYIGCAVNVFPVVEAVVGFDVVAVVGALI